MACHECIFSSEDDCNPNNFVCECTELFKGKPNEHYMHVLHANHNCMQYAYCRAEVTEKKKLDKDI